MNYQTNMGKGSETFLLVLLALIIPPLAVGLVRGLDSQFWINVILLILLWPISVIHAIVIVCGGKPKAKEGTAPNAHPHQVQHPPVVQQQQAAPNPAHPQPQNVAHGAQTTGSYQNEGKAAAPAVPTSVSAGVKTSEIQQGSSVDKPPPAYEG